MGSCQSAAIFCQVLEYWNVVVTWFAIALGSAWVFFSTKMPFLVEAATASAELINGGFTWVGKYFQAFASLAAVSFAAYKWWWNRQSMLMRRMEAILRDRDKRLSDLRGELTSLIEQPGPGTKPTVPLFVVAKLQKALKRRNWLPIVRARRLPTATDRALEKATIYTQKLIAVGEETVASRRQELFTSHLLQGAIASARSARHHDVAQQQVQNNLARGHIQKALDVPGFARDPQALELHGIQLLKIGNPIEAADIFSTLEDIACDLDVEDGRNLNAARAAYLLAQAQIESDAPGESVNANATLIQAIGHTSRLAPFARHQDQLFLARMHELHACVRIHLDYQIRNQSIYECRSAYKTLQTNLETDRRARDLWLWFLPSVKTRKAGLRDLARKAEAGLKRLDDYQSGTQRCVCGRGESGLFGDASPRADSLPSGAKA